MAKTKDGVVKKTAPKTKTAKGAKPGKIEKPGKASKTEGAQVVPKGYVPSLQKKYREEIVPKLLKDFGYTSVMQVPKLQKIVINQGIGSATADKKLVDAAQQELTIITGQKAVQTVSKKDISNFKLRKGMPIGVKTTLRAAKMYEFLERLISVSLPRIRDFKGISEKFDGRGNYTLGVKEQIIFPEIDIDKINKIMGLEMTFVTSAQKDEEAFALLREFGLPFKNIKKQS
ncbi:MAG: 50S ribosomal protein L5 [Bacteroidales bacterium]